jgi:hypothetical protein
MNGGHPVYGRTENSFMRNSIMERLSCGMIEIVAGRTQLAERMLFSRLAARADESWPA